MKHEDFYKAVLELKTVEECHDFFEDIATKNEVQDFSDRLMVAKLLHEGNTYESITKETQISSATIARINRALAHGTGAYKKILDRLKKD
ncbi:MAG: hypothetical protein GX038_00290 [Erysipelothrix sp.]|nr:hypothetical protein [Erysipelothrix sp.]